MCLQNLIKNHKLGHESPISIFWIVVGEQPMAYDIAERVLPLSNLMPSSLAPNLRHASISLSQRAALLLSLIHVRPCTPLAVTSVTALASV